MSYQLASREVQTDSTQSGRHAADIGFQAIVGRSAPLLQAVQFSMRVATRRGTTVLIVGETGTGKGLFARGIHYASPEAEEPFVTVNCATIPANLLESELFGHERGAFTDARARKRGLIELAGAGTLFLDEVSELPLKLQPKLLRALEERRFRRVGGTDEIEARCRIIAASNGSFEDALSEGRFREDLFYRLNVLRINVPSLKERGEDTVILARHFMEQISHEMGVSPKPFSVEATDILKLHDWPGNIREMKNVIQRAIVLSDGLEITASDLSIFRRNQSEDSDKAQGQAIHIPDIGMTLGEIEAEAIRITLRLTKGNRSAASRVLAISRPTIHRKIREHGLEHSFERSLEHGA